jgi:multimeric flavodoxin WrbA
MTLTEQYQPSLQLQKTISHLSEKNKVLLIATSNRWEGAKEIAKSTQMAEYIQSQLGERKCTLIDASKLNLYYCEGNVSNFDKNKCGERASKLKDDKKNPTGHHRCWASFNHKEDELWKISKELFQADAVLFLGSVRWGQMNAVYQKLIERLSWLENRHSTYNESNLLKDKDAGIICIGQNWNGAEVIRVQKQVLQYYGFNVPDVMCWNWQYTKNAKDETQESYKKAPKVFQSVFEITLTIKEQFIRFLKSKSII